MSLTLYEGTLFARKYRVIRCLAAGAMGAVYEVVHLDTERRRALKVMLPHLASDPGFRSRFHQEARIAARVESTFVVEVFDAGIDEETGMPFLAMELLRGEDLSARVHRARRLPPEEVVVYLRQTAVALDKLHAASIIHRDLKPGNLFVCERDDGLRQIKVLDFGIAKLIADANAGAATTAAMGTPLYMAPEQMRGEPLSRAVDIYALGMIAYTLLVGKAYWLEDSRASQSALHFGLIAMHGPQEPACARAERGEVQLPPAFDEWFATICARDPQARFPTAQAAVGALAVVFDMPPASISLSFGPSADPPSRRDSIGPESIPAAARSSTILDAHVALRRRARRPLLAVVTLASLAVAVGLFASRRVPEPAPEARAAPAMTPASALASVATPPSAPEIPSAVPPPAAPAAPAPSAPSASAPAGRRPAPPSAPRGGRVEVPSRVADAAPSSAQTSPGKRPPVYSAD